jgi:NAD(P) transhydrogenase subunit beta
MSILIGGITFSGSLVAYGKLSEKIPGKAYLITGQRFICSCIVVTLIFFSYRFIFGLATNSTDFLAVIVLALVLGIMFVLPIGGADMPVVISLLNSCSGLAACTVGFVLNNNLLIVAGSLVGASGLILTNIMCKAMNRSLINVLFSSFGATLQNTRKIEGNVKQVNIEETYLMLEAASSIVIVPGYGMAVAQAQHAIHELAVLLETNDCEVNFAIHPVAGRMPGHMNVLLAEGNVPYEKFVEMEDINRQMAAIDVAIVIGANDIVNPAANDDKSSPIYGMPIIKVQEAGTVIVLKRSMASGFSGVENGLFYGENTLMLFADAKKSIIDLVAEFKS